MQTKEATVKPYVYKLTNQVNGKIYIGISQKELGEKFKEHKNSSKNPNYRDANRPIYVAIREYGPENFAIEVVEEFDDWGSARGAERDYIKSFNSFYKGGKGLGYNVNTGGEGADRKLVSEETREKLRYISSNISEETREKMRNAIPSEVRSAYVSESYNNNPELRKLRGDHMKERFEDPKYKQKIANVRVQQRETFSKSNSEKSLKRYQDPDRVKEASENTSKNWKNDEYATKVKRERAYALHRKKHRNAWLVAALKDLGIDTDKYMLHLNAPFYAMEMAYYYLKDGGRDVETVKEKMYDLRRDRKKARNAGLSKTEISSRNTREHRAVKYFVTDRCIKKMDEWGINIYEYNLKRSSPASVWYEIEDIIDAGYRKKLIEYLESL